MNFGLLRKGRNVSASWARVATMIPIVGAFGGMLLLGEHPQWSDLAALVLVVAALAVVLLPQRRAA